MDLEWHKIESPITWSYGKIKSNCFLKSRDEFPSFRDDVLIASTVNGFFFSWL